MCFAHMFDTSGKVGAAECSEQIPFALDHRQFTSPTEASVGSVEPDEVCLDRATCSGRGLPELDNRRSLLVPLEVWPCNRGCLGEHGVCSVSNRRSRGKCPQDRLGQRVLIVHSRLVPLTNGWFRSRRTALT